MAELHFHALGDWPLVSGQVLKSARLGWCSEGRLNARRDNAVVLFSYYTGTHLSYQPLIGPGKALDPAHWFIVRLNLFGNGVSTSPSNSLQQPGAQFPRVTLEDNIRAQYHLLIETLGIEQIALAYGWSMGAMQAWHWAAAWPTRVRNLLAVCGSARCWPLNHTFLEGVKAALQTDEAWLNGLYRIPPLRGLAAFGRAYAGWAYSAAFWREQGYQQLGHDSAESLLRDWEQDHQRQDANDLLTVLDSWQRADISSLPGFNGDLAQAVAAVRARTIVMPGSTDAYFTAEEAAIEAGWLVNGELRPIHSKAGHCAGAPGRFKRESGEVEAAIRQLLA